MREQTTSRFLTFVKGFALHLGQKKWNLGENQERIIRRWLTLQHSPTMSSVQRLASSIWSQISRPERKSSQEYVFRRIKEHSPEAPVESWTAEEFVDFCLTLLPTERLTVAAEVFVARKAAASHGAFKPVENGGAPVRAASAVRIRISLNRPAFPYVFWITPESKAQPNYPWTPGFWEGEVRKEKKVALLALPLETSPNKRWTFGRSAGLETLVVVVRERKLSEEQRCEVRHILSGLPKVHRRARLEAEPVKFVFADAHPRGTRLLYRQGGVTDFIWKRHQDLAVRLTNFYDAGVCVSFRNDG